MQTISNHLPFMQYLIAFVTEAAPYLMIIAAFTFFYMFIPNTRVTFRAGAVAGVVSGFLFQSLGWGFGSIVVSASGSGTYAIYSGFAILILFMMWMYISWLILLVGSSVAFYVQHPEYIAPLRRSGDISIRQRETLALQVMAIVAQRYYQSRKPFSASDFVYRLRVQIQGVTRVLRALQQAGLLTENHEDPPRYLPNAPLEKTSLKTVLDAVRNDGTVQMIALRVPRRPVAGVAEVTASIDAALDAALASVSVRDMALGDDSKEVDEGGDEK